MKNLYTKPEKKEFYRISLCMLGYYVALVVLSGLITLFNYMGSRLGGNTQPYNFASIVLSTLSSIMVIVFWFVGRKQQDGLEIIMNKKVAWTFNVIVDLFELSYVCLSTIASLYNGGIIKEQYSQLMPIVSFLLVGTSTFDFIFSLTCVLLAKRKIKTQQ